MNNERPSPMCRNCHWWARNKQQKSGDCTKSAGRIVMNVSLEITRTAYPRTLSTDSCDDYVVEP